jgi:hypothetical protein
VRLKAEFPRRREQILFAARSVETQPCLIGFLLSRDPAPSGCPYIL